MADNEKLLKCSCKECGNHLEFAASMLNTVITCPHCGQWTELTTGAKASRGEPTARKTPVVAIVVVVVVLAAVGAGLAFQKMKKGGHETKPIQVAAATPANPPPEPTPPPQPTPTETVADSSSQNIQHTKSHDDLKVGTIELQKTPGTSLVHAVGTVKNDSDFVRFGVKIELTLFNKDGKKIGTAQDYQSTIEPRKDWRFKALVADPRTASAQFSAISEDE